MSEAERIEAIKAVQLELFQARMTVRRLVSIRRKLLTSGQKTCRKCNETMSADQFYRDKRYASGLRPYCIECFTRAVIERQQRARAA